MIKFVQRSSLITILNSYAACNLLQLKGGLKAFSVIRVQRVFIDHDFFMPINRLAFKNCEIIL